MTLAPWQGGRRALGLAGAAGALGISLSAAGLLAGDPRRVILGYLVAFACWLGIAVGSLLLLATFHAAGSTWPVVLRRFLEAVPATIPLFAVLFVPILLGARWIFPWAAAGPFPDEVARLMEHRRPYLNGPFFAIRAVAYFAVWIAIGHLLRSWSLRQDAAGGAALARRQRALGAGSLPLLALTMTFAAFDWMMTQDPRFHSTIFGLYWFAGSFLGAFAVAIVAGALTRGDPAQFGAHLTAEHFHSLGKYLLSFVAFWGYMAFSQFLLVWIANVPDEVPWYVVRTGGGWLWVGAFLALFKFLVPFFLLLSRALKRDPRRLSLVAGWLLLAQWVDVYWVVMPYLDERGPRPSIFDLTSFVGVGGLAVAFAILRMRGVAAIPLGDPRLDGSLRYLPR